MNMKHMLDKKGKSVFTIHPDASLSECIAQLNEKHVGALMVMDANEEIFGIISERDILRLAYARQCQICEIPVRQVMTPRDRLLTVSMEEGIEEVMRHMTDNHVRHIPVMDGGRVAGMVSIGDVVKALLEMSREENEQMKDYISGRYSQG